MSVLKLFTVRDNKAGTYGQPFALANRNVALRTLSGWVRNPESFISQYPDDFELFEVGDFDQMSGKLIPLPVPDYVGRASELLPQAVAS